MSLSKLDNFETLGNKLNLQNLLNLSEFLSSKIK